MSLPEPILIAEGVEDAPEQLQKQFTDPFDCLRELLQNAIDAGSTEVHVSCTYEEDFPGIGSGLGAAVLRVKDYGEGMDRHTIDTRLVRLFSSDKLRDKTKLGKYGIGFISVFVMRPDVVCVDTGKHGESWRVLFRPDRSFVRVYLHEPVEGTTIRLWKSMSRAEYDLFEPRVRRALHKHGEHLEVALTYQGTLFNKPLDYGALIAVESRENGETIVVSYRQPGEPDLAQFENRGLTLLSRPSDIVGVSYVISSPQLEHTLGRDNLVQDEHYAGLLSRVKALAGEPLIEELLRRLEEGLRNERPEAELLPLQARLAMLIGAGTLFPATLAQHRVARSLHGDLLPLDACLLAGSAGQMFCAAHPSPLSAAVQATGKLVLEDWQAPFVAALCQGEAPRLEKVFALPLPWKSDGATIDRTAQAKALCTATLILIHAAQGSVEQIAIGDLDYAGSGIAGLPAVVQTEPFTLSTLEEALPQRRWWDGVGQPLTWVLNADHGGIKALLLLALKEPELAAYNLIKLCFVGGALSPELDSRLLTLAMEKRCQRQDTDR